MNEPIAIEIVSDAVCPWCWIGKRRLDRALAALPHLNVERVWRPFMLNPDMPADSLAAGCVEGRLAPSPAR